MPFLHPPKDIIEIFNQTGCGAIKVISGQVLFYENFYPGGYFYLINGKIKVIKELPGGIEKMFGIIRRGQFAGVREFLSNLPYNYTAVALESTSVFYISPSNHFKLLKDAAFSYLINHSDSWRR